MNHVVGIAEMLVSDQPDDVLITYSLGSCLGVAAMDVEAGVGGLIHCQLPMSSLDPERAKKQPAMFVDSGIPALFEEMFRRGAAKGRLQVRVAGGAQILDDKGLFKIGQRNHTVLRKLLWKNEILIKAEDVGGSIARTLTLDMASGAVTVRSNGDVTVL